MMSVEYTCTYVSRLLQFCGRLVWYPRLVADSAKPGASFVKRAYALTTIRILVSAAILRVCGGPR